LARIVGKTPADLLRGTLDVLVLKALSRRPMHGFEIANWLRDHSRGTLELDDAGLYKALYRLEAQGAIQSEWRMSENNRRARYYTPTADGRRKLRVETTVWREYALAVSRVLRTT
jgi:PadR family transcriptional regulator PadR